MKTTTKSKTPRKSKPAAQPKKAPKKKVKSNIVLTTLAISAAGILGYLGWQYYKKRKAARTSSPDLDTYLQPLPSTYVNPGTDTPSTEKQASLPSGAKDTSTRVSTTAPKPATANTTGIFPLKRGSKNAKVKALQQALITKFGNGILPKFGADGDFGTETATALKKAGLPATIDESTFYVITQSESGISDKNMFALKLRNAASAMDFATTLSLLKQMNTKEDYRQINGLFAQQRLRGVRQTLVTGLLNSFSSDSQKQQIRYEFIRMGLKYDGNKWSLDGFDGRPVVTIEPTNVWLNATERVTVPAMMVLGAEVSRKLDYTLFENNSKYFLVSTKSIKYL